MTSYSPPVPVTAAARAVERFNREHPVGTPVTYWPGTRDAAARDSLTRTPAWLVVADWLDAIAKEAAEFLSLDTPEGPCCEVLPACEGHGSIWGCERCGEFIGGGCTCWDGALKTARAYLGREDA